MKHTRAWCRPVAAALLVFGALAILAVPVGAADAPTITVVASNKTWTETPVTVHKGDQLTINAGGTMKVGADGELTKMTPAGIAWGNACNSAVGSRSWPVGGIACWSLIGRIGSGKPFEVGRARMLTAPSDGRLALGVNDDYLGDNGGSWRAVVMVKPAASSSGGSSILPLIAGIVLLGLVIVLVLLFLRRRKKNTSDSPAAPVLIVLPEAQPSTTPAGAPLDPTDVDVNIFAVGFPNRSTLRVGYNFFPEGTVVYYRVVDVDVDVRGEFTTEGGGSTRHFVELPLTSPLGDDRDTAEVDFDWTVGAVPFAYKVASRVTSL